MMLDRDRIGFWTRIVAIGLAVIFVGSFIFFGIGSSGLTYNVFDLLGSQDEEQTQQAAGSDEQIERAQADLEKNPEDPAIIRRLAGLYIQSGRTDEAVKVLERGRDVAPEDPYIPLLLGQAHDGQAQVVTEEQERQEAYAEAGVAYAAAAEVQEADSRKAQAYLLAGQAYDQAGDKGRTIQYWNSYLDLEPEGEQSDAVRERIATLLEGGEDTTGGATPAPAPEDPAQ